MSSGFYSNFSNKEPSSFIEQLILELTYCIFILYLKKKKKKLTLKQKCGLV